MTARLHVAIADTPATRARGLGERRELGPDEGMLFVLAPGEPAIFTNARTFVPLSIAWLDAAGKVLELRDMRAQKEGDESGAAETYAPGAGATPASFAVEAPRGWFAAAGIGPGSRLALTGEPAADGSGMMWSMASAPPMPPLYVAPPPAPPSAEIRVGENGYIHGVDGMLDQIAGALSRHAGPMLVRDVLPAVRDDHELQTRVGTAVGQRIADTMTPYLFVGTTALVVMAAIQLGRWQRERRASGR